MSFLLAHIFFPWFDEAIGKNVIPKATSLVRELPEKGAEVICHLEQNIEALIMENQSYYYKVSFIDETGIEREGYVAKRNLKIINQEKTSDEQPTVSGNNSSSFNKNYESVPKSYPPPIKKSPQALIFQDLRGFTISLELNRPRRLPRAII